MNAPIDARPCAWCSGAVMAMSGVCSGCGAKHLQPQPGPQEQFLACGADIVLLGGAAYGGKALPLDEPVPTPSGWVEMGALRCADLVFDEHGQPTVITEIHPIQPAPRSMRVVFDDGAAITASADHLWLADGVVVPTSALQRGAAMPVAPAVAGPCRIPVSRRMVRRVASVAEVDPVQMRCITVANQSGLFLAGERHLVTHNSFGLLLDALRYADTPGWIGLILRRHSNDYSDPSSIFEKAAKLFGQIPGVRIRRSGARDITFPSGATLAFRHLDSVNFETSYQGMEYAWIGVDEATHFELHWLRWLITRMRTSCGTMPSMRMTCNPDADHVLAQWVLPYLILDKDDPKYGCADRAKSGVTRYWAVSSSKDEIVWGDTREAAADASGRPLDETKSFAFIAATLEDNPIGLIEDPGYIANLAVSGRTNEKRLRDGNWLIKDDTGGLIRSGYIGTVDRPLAPILRRVRAWDLASTRPVPGTNRADPDYTIGILILWDIHGRWYIADMVACRDETTEVDRLMAATASKDGPEVTQVMEIEPGSAGKKMDAYLRLVLRSQGRCGPIYSSHAMTNKIEKARPMTNQLSLGMKGNRPRVIAIEYDPTTKPGEVFEPIAYIIDNGWTGHVYEDKGEHPPTLGALFWRQVLAFGRGTEHDDVPDVMAIAHRTPVDAGVEPDDDDPVTRALRLS